MCSGYWKYPSLDQRVKVVIISFFCAVSLQCPHQWSQWANFVDVFPDITCTSMREACSCPAATRRDNEFCLTGPENLNSSYGDYDFRGIDLDNLSIHIGQVCRTDMSAGLNIGHVAAVGTRPWLQLRQPGVVEGKRIARTPWKEVGLKGICTPMTWLKEILEISWFRFLG